MKRLKPQKVSKLFYDKYVFKVALNCKLASEFRDVTVEQVQGALDIFIQKIANSKNGIYHRRPWDEILVDDVSYADSILSLLRGREDYALRVESSTLNIYSNDETLIDELAKLRPLSVWGIYKPASGKIKDYLLANKNKVVWENYTHKYKVTVNALGDNADAFVDWAKQMPNKVKLNRVPKQSEAYFYVSDLKVLSLCKLFLGGKLRRVDEMVKESEI